MHNFYICKGCQDFSEKDKGDMTRQKSSCINGCTIPNKVVVEKQEPGCLFM